MKFTAKTFIFLAIFCLIFIAVDSQTASNTTSPTYKGPSTSGSSLSAVNTATSSSKPSSGLPSYTPITYYYGDSSSSCPPKFFIPFLIGFVTGIGVLVLICIAIFIFRKKRANVGNVDILEIAGRDSREESR
ncbi:hypothetical protein Glove_232g218 [Diversispora epigaea]|uniref:Transmembrane protein n=1 Tax=Diversispora epigaea TaxID=1348612 RepID=A0A397IC35_9GLOM|nr:hypothetical protein Glove_232g218 [Diversispora epigaea]